jgi:hypothetical protein
MSFASKLLITACRSIIDRFLGKVVYQREHAGGTDWLLLRLRRSVVSFAALLARLIVTAVQRRRVHYVHPARCRESPGGRWGQRRDALRE